MQTKFTHSWDITPREAVALQKDLAGRLKTCGKVAPIRLVAGADCTWEKSRDQGIAGVRVFRFPELVEVERRQVRGPTPFPYVPGLLSFREGPLLLQAFERLRHTPDLVLFDGQGIAHPRRMGIASHMGVLLDIPSVGCAKSRLCGTHREPGKRRGNRALLRDERTGERIGYVLRTRDSVRPIYVSIGHRVDLDESVRIVLRCGDGCRVPLPTRLADHYVGALRKGEDIPEYCEEDNLP